MAHEHTQTRLTEAHWAEIKALYHQVVDVDQAQRARLLQDATCPPFVLAYVHQLLAAEGFTVAMPARSMHAALGDLQSRVAPGDQLGPYRLVRLLGQGGMGLVYLAERSDGVYRQSVAIKLMARHFDSQLDRQLFVQERQILAALQHPHIARLLDGGETDGYPYLVMEYIEGPTLARYCVEHALAIEGRLSVVAPIVDAVSYAHQRAIIHKDLKPANILVDREGHAHLIDFGIARFDQAEEYATIESHAHTPAFASPEQKAGGDITVAADIYALGQILNQLLKTAPDYPDLSRFRQRQLDAIVNKARALEAIDRYASASALQQDVNRWRDRRAVSAYPQTRWYRLRTFVQRNALLTLIAGASFVLVLSALAVTLGSLRTERATNHALIVANEQTALESAKLSEVNSFLTNMFDSIETDAKGVDIRVVDVLDQAVENLQQSARTPALHAELSLTLGKAFTAIAEMDKANAIFALAQQRSAEALGQGHEQTWRLRQRLVSNWMRTRAFDQVVESGLSWLQQRHDSGSAQVNELRLQIQVAESQYWMDEKTAALTRLEQARTQITEQLGERHPLLDFHDETLAVLFLWDQRAAEAEQIFRRLIERDPAIKNAIAKSHYQLRNLLTYSLYEQQKYDEAIAESHLLLNDATSYSLTNIDTAAIYNSIAVFEQGDGNMSGSIETLTAAVARYAPLLGEEHRLVRVFHLNLGDAYLALKDFQPALRWYQKNMPVARILNDDFASSDYRLISQMSICLTRLGDRIQSRQILDHLTSRVEAEFTVTALGGTHHSYKAAEALWTWSFQSRERGRQGIERWHDDAVSEFGTDDRVSQELLELRLEFYRVLGMQQLHQQFHAQSQLAKHPIR